MTIKLTKRVVTDVLAGRTGEAERALRIFSDLRNKGAGLGCVVYVVNAHFAKPVLETTL